MKHAIAAVLLTAIIISPWLVIEHPDQARRFTDVLDQIGNQLAAAILSRAPVTVANLKSVYATAPIPGTPKVRILLVPGHEPDYGGAEYRNIKERNLTVELAQDLQVFLNGDPHYQAFITRDASDWNQTFADYFKNDWSDIIAWEKAAHTEMTHLIAVGSTTQPVSTVYHNTAPVDVAMRLYGITKWANENNIDITIHIHFNDNPGHSPYSPGDHSGFAIYVPVAQYGNSITTKAVANTVFKRLSAYNPISDLPAESTGIVNEPDLIAIGADNTAASASMLIEYAYIYEPQLNDPAIRPTFLKELAYETYLGLQDFFQPNQISRASRAYDSLTLPHSWSNPITGKNDSSADVFALQTALVYDGEYPPAGKSLNDCPRTGKVGGCTTAAITAFQQKYGITGDLKGVAGKGTIEQLNRLYSTKNI
jgi:N-acetylmuramoyl-L-alanine amidase